MISHFFALATKVRPKRRRARPKLPNRAERLYLGALRRYADGFREAVLAEVREQYPELAGERKDALTGGPFRGMRGVRLRLTKLREMLPLDIVGAEVADHAQKEAERVIGLKNSELFLRGQVAGWRRSNVDLITRFTEEQLDRVESVLEDYDGLRVEDTASELESVFGVTRARAELIARDQVLKLNSDMAEQSQTAAGVTHYRWSTSQDGSVRDDHADLEGEVFSWDDPPITNQSEVDKGKPERRNHPGRDFQCRCVAIPVLDEYDEPARTEMHEGLDGGWDEAAHPRAPAGSGEGGQFTSGEGGAPASGVKSVHESHGVRFNDHDKIQRAARGILGRDLTHEDVKALTKVHELDIPGAAKVEYEVWPHGVDGLNYEARVLDHEGNELVVTKRQLETSWETGRKEVEVHHDLMTVAEHLQGQGIGSALFEKQLAEYQARGGIDRITTEAAWIGTYQWPRLGFSMADAKDFEPLKQDADKWLKEHGVSVGSKDWDKVKTPHDLAKLKTKQPVTYLDGQGYDKTTEQAGKAFLVSRGINEGVAPLHMKFDLGPKSKELAAYKKVKLKDAKAKTK